MTSWPSSLIGWPIDWNFFKFWIKKGPSKKLIIKAVKVAPPVLNVIYLNTLSGWKYST